jgi:hypothetical protein
MPDPPPHAWTLDEVVNHLKTAMVIELHAIPLYLYAMYSIKDGGVGTDTRQKIRGSLLLKSFYLHP